MADTHIVIWSARMRGRDTLVDRLVIVLTDSLGGTIDSGQYSGSQVRRALRFI